MKLGLAVKPLQATPPSAVNMALDALTTILARLGTAGTRGALQPSLTTPLSAVSTFGTD